MIRTIKLNDTRYQFNNIFTNGVPYAKSSPLRGNISAIYWLTFVLVCIILIIHNSLGQSNQSFFTRQKKALTSGRRRGKNSGSATGDRTQGLWLCAPVLWPLSCLVAATTALTNPLLDVYQRQRFTVGWLLCCSLQPTVADTMSSYVVYELTTN